jgi:hypothetical protein
MVASVFAGSRNHGSRVNAPKNNDYLTMSGNSPLAAAAR